MLKLTIDLNYKANVVIHLYETTFIGLHSSVSIAFVLEFAL